MCGAREPRTASTVLRNPLSTDSKGLCERRQKDACKPLQSRRALSRFGENLRGRVLDWQKMRKENQMRPPNRVRKGSEHGGRKGVLGEKGR